MKREDRMPLKMWLALVGLTCSTFIFNTSEFIPIGLLTDIGRDFNMDEAGAGMLISVYAWVVMLLSLPLMILASRFELRKLLLGLLGIFTIFQVMSFCSGSYAMLMISRIGVACTHAIFWSIISPIAVKMTPSRFRAIALSMVVTGSSIAMILGMPLGRMIGLKVGWRMTFLSIGIFSFLTLLYLIIALPKISSVNRFSVSKLPALFHNKALVGLYLFVLLFSASYYTCYSYIEPFLKQVAGMSDSFVTEVLMMFGGAGIVGSIIFSKFYMRNKYRFTTSIMIVFSLCMLLIFPLSSIKWALVVLCILWGMTATTFNVSMQNEVLYLTDDSQSAVAMSISSGIFNMGIGCGTYLGGVVCTHSSIAYIGYTASIMAILAVLYWLFRLQKLYKSFSKTY